MFYQTEQCERVLLLASEEAHRRGLDSYRPEYILWGIAKDWRSVAANALWRIGYKRWPILPGDNWEPTLWENEEPKQPPQSRAAKKPETNHKLRVGPSPLATQVVEQAAVEAIKMSHYWIGTEHLLLALGTVESSTLTFLKSLNFTYDRIHDAILEVLTEMRQRDEQQSI